MDLAWGSEESKKFVTNVGLITSNGIYGDNIMACEWTHHISYHPGLIVVCINHNDATNENIKKTKEFGVNLCAHDQNIISNISGSNTGKKVDKINALKELGYEFYKANKINCLMVRGAILNAECKIINILEIGDHTIFVGEVVNSSISNKEPLVYHGNKYWKLGSNIEKPNEKELDKINKAIEKYRK